MLWSPNQMIGYFKDEEQTGDVLRVHKDGLTWVHTGDLGHVEEDGFKVYPSVMEKVFNEQASVSQCKVVGISDKKHDHGQIPVTYIVLKEGTYSNINAGLKELETVCRQALPEYYMEGCEFKDIDVLPLTPIGKVDYRALEKMAEGER